MDSQIVSITDLKEYDDQIKAWLPKSYVQIGANSTIAKPKICVVDDLPASPAADTIYFVKNGAPTPETYNISPTSKTFDYNVTSEQSFQVTNGSGVAQTIKSVSLSGGNSDKFATRYSGTTAYCNPNGNNTSGSNYTTTLIVTATTADGDKTFNVSIVQTSGSADTYTITPTSKEFYANVVVEQNFVVKNSGGTAQTIKSVSLSGTDSDRFSARYSGTLAYCKPTGMNTGNTNYNATLTVVASTTDGDKTFTVNISQKHGAYLTVQNKLSFNIIIEAGTVGGAVMANSTQEIYVGESFPVTITAPVIRGGSIGFAFAPDTIKFDGFTSQSKVDRGGVPEYVITSMSKTYTSKVTIIIE